MTASVANPAENSGDSEESVIKYHSTCSLLPVAVSAHDSQGERYFSQAFRSLFLIQIEWQKHWSLGF